MRHVHSRDGSSPASHLFAADKLADFALEHFNFRNENEHLRFQCASDGGQHFLSDLSRTVLSGQETEIATGAGSP